MLSSTPPTIEEVLIGGQAWRDAFVAKVSADSEGAGGFRLTSQSTAQPLPWSNLDRLTLRFNEAVDVQSADLHLQGVQSGLTIPLAQGGFTYDATRHTATWTFAQPLGADKYAILLVDRVANAMGIALDGEGAPRTGDGAAGGDFVFQFSVVPGDGNQDGVTNMRDGLGVRQRMFAAATSSGYSTRYDFDGSGEINIVDGLGFRDQLFSEVPQGALDLEGPLLVAGLQRDTAALNTTDFDGVTSDAAMQGVVADSLGTVSLTARVDSGPAVPVTVAADGSFAYAPGLALDGSADGGHVVHFLARDGFGNKSTFDVPFTLDTQGPAIGPLSLSAGSGFVGPQSSSAGRVTLLGASTPGLTVTLVGTGMSALVNHQGEFQFPSVPLVVGANTFTAAVTDAAGNTTQVPTVIQRVELAAQQDPVLRWNQALLEAVQLDASAPTFASRAMAMVHAAIYDAVSAIEGTTGYSVTLAAPTGISLEAAVSGAAHRVLSYLYPAQQALFNTVRTAALGQVPDGAAETGGVAFGQAVGDAIIALRADDGWDDFVDYVPGTDPGDWQQTEPLYAPALDPQWANLPSFSGADLDELTPAGPPSLSSLQWATALNEVKSLGSFNSTTRTADQLQIARFWADGSGTFTPPGHWNKIAQQVAVAAGNSISENARLFAKLDIALADAAILAWKAKFETDFWRPFTAIHNAADDGNDLTTADASWQPLLITPNFPEYTSGHSTFSGAAAAVLTSVFGANYSFSTTSSGLLNVTRTYASFDAAAAEAGRSRIYGGIHYEFSNQDGETAGRALAAQVLSTFDAAADVVAPKIVMDTDSGGTRATNQTIAGRVLDNLSGVATLTASVDGAAATPVTFDVLGDFTFTTALALNGVAEGEHTISLIATDFQGNVSDPQVFTFTLDTQAPTIQILGPEEGATLEAGSLLTGLANATGSSIVELKYAFTGQPARTIPFDAATGEFSVPLNTAALAPGATVLTVSTRDAAGHSSSVIRNLTVAQRAAFSVERFTPLNGAQDVGSTYRPQVFFSRAVNPTSLNANNFYATGPNGAKLAANIVPAGDGSFAWLFFTQPMPSASRITVHVNGATILAAADGAQLDADDNGTVGGELTFSFSTVSLTPLVGTSLSGKVVEAGPDLKPMTFDDIRVGPDQVLHTPDDVFLTPLAGVKVFIVGLESQFVLTDAQGNFSFASAPAGNVKLAIDGRTATNGPTGTFFPEMVMDLNLEVGRANTVMGTMGTREQQEANRDRQEVYLPRLQTSILQNVSGGAATTITTSEAAAPNITPEQRALLTIQVQPGSMRDQNGNLVAAGQVGISTVPASLVREMLPPGLLQHTFDITIQSPGVTNFATPAPMTFPNLFGGKPGEQLNFLSFDHTTGRLVIEGTATVSADGLSVSTDPGTGITHPGWHGLAPPGSETKPDQDDNVVAQGTEFGYSVTTELISNRPAPPAPIAGPPVAGGPQAAAVVTDGVRDYLLTDNSERVRFTVKNETRKAKSDGSYLKVRFIIDPEIAHKYLDGLTKTEFSLIPGQSANFDFTFKPDLAKTLKLNHDLLLGAKYLLEIARVNGATGLETVLPESGNYYLYRYVDAMDDIVYDGRLKFPDTINDGAGGALRTRTVEFRGDTSASVIPTLVKRAMSAADQANVSDFEVTQFAKVDGKYFATLTFDPRQLKVGGEVVLELQTPSEDPRKVTGVSSGLDYELLLVGSGVGPRNIYLNKGGLETQLERIANNRRPQDITLEYTLPKGKKISDLSTQFVVSFNGRVTAPLPLTTSGTALYLNLIPVVGFSNFTVVESTELTEITTGAQKGTTQVVQNYRIEFSDSVPNVSTKFVVLPPIGGTFKSTVAFDFNDNDSQINAHELALINTPEKRAAFAANVLGRVRQHFAGVSSTVTLHDENRSGAPFSVDWTTVYENQRSGRTLTVKTETLPLLGQLLKRRKTLNSAQFEFELAAIMAKTQSAGIEIFVEQFFAMSYPYYDTSFDFATRAMAKTTAHELGHNLGLMHNAVMQADVYTDEVQVVDTRLLGPDDFFSLSFVGEPTEPIRPGATAVEVRDALRALTAFKAKQAIDVQTSGDGVYTIKFALPKSATNPDEHFHGVDMPELVLFGPTGPLFSSVGTTVNGDTTLKFPFEIFTTNSQGVEQSTRNDIMAAGPVRGDASFQENGSGAGLKLATRGRWTSADAKDFVSQMLKIIKHTGAGFLDTLNPVEGEESADQDNSFFEGSFLELLATDPDGTVDFVPEVTDFGSASTVTPSVKRFSLQNLGSEPATIRSIGITKGNAVFSTPTIPVTVLGPGESLEFDVTFAPDAALDFEGTLSIDSDLPEFNGQFELVGDGQPPNIPAISLSATSNTLVPFYNNLGAARVGEQTSFTGGGGPLVTNNGTSPLVITEIRVGAGQGSGEWTTPALTAPITLQPGQSTGIGFSFIPSKVGLRPGALEVVSNDPRTPVLRVPVVATGVIVTEDSLGQNIYHGADLGNDYVAVTDNFTITNNNRPVLRTVSDDAGNWEFFLPAERSVIAVTYDPVSGLVSSAGGVTNAAGINTVVNRGNFIPSIFPDTDGDGLPDDVEFAIGTNPNNLDTDNDGKNDFAELDSGRNPLDDRPARTGVVSALPTGVTALDVKLAADFRDASRTLAFVASGQSGVTVADVTDFARPISLAQLELAGTVNNVSLDVERRRMAASSLTGGVHILDIADPARPQLLHTIAHEGPDPVAAVELYDGLVYVGVGGKIRVFDAAGGALNLDFALGNQRVEGMSRDGDRLYVTALDIAANQRVLRTIDITATGLTARGSVVLPGVTTTGDPYVVDGLIPSGVVGIPDRFLVAAWIPAGDRLVTVDVSAPANPTIVTANQPIAQGGANDIELNGSGFGVIAGVINPGGSAIVIDAQNPSLVNQQFTRFALPGFGQAVELSGGLAYIAAAGSGLQLVNFLQFDTGFTPPTVQLDPLPGDLDPARNGLQLQEASTITIGHRITDDVQVRTVELMVDGAVVRTEISYPYDLTTTLPTIAQTGNQAVLQVRATDTGGNIRLSDPIVIDLLADAIAPTITSLEPAAGSTQTLSQRKVVLQFSEALDPATVIPANFVLQGPAGAVTPIAVTLRQKDTRVEILYPPLAEGVHTFTTLAALVKDRVGNSLGTADIVSTFTIAPAVRQPTIRWVNDAGGAWDSASNWRDAVTSAARVPTTTDDVLIDVPTDALITFGTGVVTVNSIVSNERFSQTGGTLTVTDTMQVNNTFRLGIDQVFSNNIPTFKGTLLRGTGGEGLTLVGESRLDTATIQTDITTTQANTQLRLTGGLALTGTFFGPTAANTNVQIGLEGSQTISSGTFLTSEAANNAGVIQFMSMSAGNTITFGQDVTLRGQFRVLSGGFYRPPSGVTTTLNVINHGTMKVGGQPDTSNFGIVLSTTADSFINHGLLESQGAGSLVLNAKSFTNSATGRIKIEQAVGSNQVFESLGAGGTTTSFVNAGSIEVINASARIMSRADGVNETWSNTGTIVVDKATLWLNGSFTSDDVVNVRNTGFVSIAGQMDNTGRTFTFNSQTRSYFVGGGTIRGGTLVMGGPNARLNLGGTLDGVTLRGDTQFGAYLDPFTETMSVLTNSGMRIINGLTLDGVISISSDQNLQVEFVGAQTISGGIFQFTPRQTNGGFGASGLYARTGGPVVIDSSVTIRSQTGGNSGPAGGGLTGNFISNASIIIDANSGLNFSGFQPLTGPVVAITNRGTITVPTSSRLIVSRPFANEGQIIVNGGTMFVSEPSNSLVDPFSNTGTINLNGGGTLNLGTAKSDGRVTFRTAELGTILDSGGFVVIGGSGNVTVIDNAGATLQINGTAQWSLSGGVVVGGTIQIDSTASLEVRGGVLKDVVINGNASSPQNSPDGAHLVGEVDVNETFTAPRILQFGHPSLYPAIPLNIRGGEFIIGTDSGASLTGYSTVSTITLDPDAILRGRAVNATFTAPINNRGQIIADQQTVAPTVRGRLFHFTAAPLTNEGTLSAVNRAILRIANLAAPNSGVVSAAITSSVDFTGAFAQAATGTTRIEIGGTTQNIFGTIVPLYGQVNVGAAATLAGKLDVRFASGYTPTVGSRYQVLNYASRTGQFDTLEVTGLATGLALTPEYNGTNMTLVVTVADSSLAGVALLAVAPQTSQFQAAVFADLSDPQVGSLQSDVTPAESRSPADELDDDTWWSSPDSPFEHWHRDERPLDEAIDAADDSDPELTSALERAFGSLGSDVASMRVGSLLL